MAQIQRESPTAGPSHHEPQHPTAPVVRRTGRTSSSVVSARIPGTSAYVDLRWSPTCKTNWARTNWNGESPSTQLRAVQCPTGYTQGYSRNNGSYWWSRMIYSPSMGVSAQWVGAPGSIGTSCA
ncbi:DUF2690 domain-containing protein [Amycolatopsis balhimycina]